MWKEVERRGHGRNGRENPAVMRARTHGKAAFLIFPFGMMSKGSVKVYSDGNGRLAFQSADAGASVYKASKASKATRCVIPSQFAHRIPFGTTDVELEKDGDMYVLDLNQLPKTT